MAQRQCEYPGCEEPYWERGYCSMHYKRFKEGRDMDAPKQQKRPRGTECAYPGCDQPHKGRGYCKTHYLRWFRGTDMDGRKPLIDRFWDKVDKSGDCWIWTASTTLDGYGTVGVGNRVRRAHVVSWEISHGPIPPGMQVCHRCDVPPCVRPEHLFLGTQPENIADMIAKGRNTRKLTDEQVLAIFHATGTQAAIADQFGIHQTHVSQIKRGVIWAHLTKETPNG